MLSYVQVMYNKLCTSLNLVKNHVTVYQTDTVCTSSHNYFSTITGNIHFLFKQYLLKISHKFMVLTKLSIHTGLNSSCRRLSLAQLTINFI